MAKKQLYKVRVREGGIKKSRFYWGTSSKDAAGRYHGSGSIMWVEKAPREQVLGVGGFFRLGDDLLKEFRKEESLLAQTKRRQQIEVKSNK